MQLEFLPDGSADCPLIRLYNFCPNEAGQLRAVVADLSAGRAERVAVHELPDVAPIDGYELVLRVGPRDAAVVQVGPVAFECMFTSNTWENVAGLIEPFAEPPAKYPWVAGGYQWLAASPGAVALLLSASGEW